MHPDIKAKLAALTKTQIKIINGQEPIMNRGQYLISLICKCGEAKPCGWDSCRECLAKAGKEFRAKASSGEFFGLIHVAGWMKNNYPFEMN